MYDIAVRFARDRRGAVTAEYVLLLAIVGSLLLAGLTQFRETLKDGFDTADSNIAVMRDRRFTDLGVDDQSLRLPLQSDFPNKLGDENGAHCD